MDRRRNASTPAAYERWSEALDRIATILDKSGLKVAERWGADVYQYEGRNVVGYAAFNQHFALWFYNGVFMSDPLGVLINANDKVTRALRQWRMTSLDEINEEAILKYMAEAVELEQRGVRLEPLKPEVGSVPHELQQLFDADPDLLRAFEKRTPGYQHEFLQHIHDAKRAETRIRRAEKVAQLLREGRTLNDKYK